MKRCDINRMETTTVKENITSNTATIQETTTPIRPKDMNSKGNQTVTSLSTTSCILTNTVPISYSQPSRLYLPPREPLDKLSRYKTRKKDTTATLDHYINILAEEPDDDDILNENVSDDVKIRPIKKAHTILSKSKTSAFHKTNPNNSESWLIATINNAIERTDKVISHHKYKFENNRPAAKLNTQLLKKYKYDFTRAISHEKGSIMEPGSDFCLVETLESLLRDHEHCD